MKYTFFIAIVIAGLASCMAPRNISNSGKVTPKGNFVAGANMSVNFSSQTSSAVADVTKSLVKELSNNDSIYVNPDFNLINKAAVAYALDPVSVGTDFYLRYGFIKGFDAGIKIAGNAKAIDVQYQFLGPLGGIDDITDEKLYGSVGLQYSSQKQELPSILADIQSRLGYKFKRKDILLPVIFSYSFGNEEAVGAFSWGLVLNYSRISYATAPAGIYDYNLMKLVGKEHSQSYFSYGVFVNCKIGYRYIYLVPAISIYNQNYGEYQLLSGDVVKLKGLTVVPSLGFRLRLGKASIN